MSETYYERQKLEDFTNIGEDAPEAGAEFLITTESPPQVPFARSGT
ncbi:MAG: hypothetical protein WHT06_12600 [Desulfobacterales bacterium]